MERGGLLQIVADRRQRRATICAALVAPHLKLIASPHHIIRIISYFPPSETEMTGGGVTALVRTAAICYNLDMITTVKKPSAAPAPKKATKRGTGKARK